MCHRKDNMAKIQTNLLGRKVRLTFGMNLTDDFAVGQMKAMAGLFKHVTKIAEINGVHTDREGVVKYTLSVDGDVFERPATDFKLLDEVPAQAVVVPVTPLELTAVREGLWRALRMSQVQVVQPPLSTAEQQSVGSVLERIDLIIIKRAEQEKGK